MSRILSMNETYIKSMNEKKLFDKLLEFSNKFKINIDKSKESIILKSLNFLKNKAKTLEDIYNNSGYILNDNLKISSEDKSLIDKKSKDIIKNFIEDFDALKDLNKTSLEPIIKNLIDKHKTNFKGVGQPLRIALTGSKFGPGIYDIIISLGKDDVEKRLTDKTIS
jgi:glutamyl-tRNA synthetase